MEHSEERTIHAVRRLSAYAVAEHMQHKAVVHTIWHELGHLYEREVQGNRAARVYFLEVFRTTGHLSSVSAPERFAETISQMLQLAHEGSVTTWRYGLCMPRLEPAIVAASRMVDAARGVRGTIT